MILFNNAFSVELKLKNSMINILHNISRMELSTRFKDFKKKKKKTGGGKTVERLLIEKQNIFHQKCLILFLLLVLNSTLSAFKHYCESFLYMCGINFHSKLSLLSFGIELTFNLKNIL